MILPFEIVHSKIFELMLSSFAVITHVLKGQGQYSIIFVRSA
jgi:hypothetical protein